MFFEQAERNPVDSAPADENQADCMLTKCLTATS
jgi:hypothetical protein